MANLKHLLGDEQRTSRGRVVLRQDIQLYEKCNTYSRFRHGFTFRGLTEVTGVIIQDILMNRT